MSDEELRRLERRAKEGGPADVGRHVAMLLREGKHVDALEHLLAIWRRTRDPSIAGIIDEVSALIPARPIDDDRQWLALAKKGSSAELARILPGIAVAHRGKKGSTRLDALLRRAEDPRLAMAAARFLATVPEHVARSPRLASRLVELIARQADVRTLIGLEKAETNVFARNIPQPWLFRERFIEAREGVWQCLRPFLNLPADLARAVREAAQGVGFATSCGACSYLPRSERFDDASFYDYGALARIYAWLRPDPDHFEEDQEFRCSSCGAAFRCSYREREVVPDEAAMGPETERSWTVERLDRENDRER